MTAPDCFLAVFSLAKRSYGALHDNLCAKGPWPALGRVSC